MKKTLISTAAVILILVIAYLTYQYYRGPKIIEAVVSTQITADGKPDGVTSDFSSDDSVYFFAKGNRFWIKEAQVVWYKGSVSSANRFLVEDNIKINDAGYFTTKLSVPEGLEEGIYSVSVYVSDTNIIQSSNEFNITE